MVGVWVVFPEGEGDIVTQEGGVFIGVNGSRGRVKTKKAGRDPGLFVVTGVVFQAARDD